MLRIDRTGTPVPANSKQLLIMYSISAQNYHDLLASVHAALGAASASEVRVKERLQDLRGKAARDYEARVSLAQQIGYSEGQLHQIKKRKSSLRSILAQLNKIETP